MMAAKLPIRRYSIRLGVAMSIYVISLLAGTYIVAHRLIAGPALWGIAVLPGLAIIGAFYAIGMLILETKDEFIRMLIVRQVLYASVFAMSLASVWGFLEDFELVAHIPAFYWAVAWFAGFGLGGAVNRFTLGTSGSCS